MSHRMVMTLSSEIARIPFGQAFKRDRRLALLFLCLVPLLLFCSADPARAAEVASNVSLISPNGDSNSDTVDVTITLDEQSDVTVDVLDQSSSPVSTIHIGAGVAAGNSIYSWNGTDGGGGVLPDGPYSIRLTATGVSGTVTHTAPIDVQVHPIAIAGWDTWMYQNKWVRLWYKANTDTDQVRFVLKVKNASGGIVATLYPGWKDPNKLGYIGYKVALPPGNYSYGVYAQDSQNSWGLASSWKDLTVAEPRLLSKMTRSRAVISPNGDKVADDVTVGYTLARPANVQVQVWTASGSYVASLTNRYQLAGAHTAWWSGMRYSTANTRWQWTWGGHYKIKVVATDASHTTMEEAVNVWADKTKPLVDKVINTESMAPFVDGYKDSARISFRTSEPGSGWITIWDPQGRKVVDGPLGWLASGWNEWSWNGQTWAGVTVPSGTYRYRITLTDSAGNSGYTETKNIPVSSYIDSSAYSIGSIYIDLSDQTLTAYDTSGTKRFKILVSSGLPGMSTPKGTYRVIKKKRLLIAYSGNAWADHPTYFREHHAIHGWPYTSGRRALRGTLGSPASHGCVRIEDSYAKFINRQTITRSTVVRVGS